MKRSFVSTAVFQFVLDELNFAGNHILNYFSTFQYRTECGMFYISMDIDEYAFYFANPKFQSKQKSSASDLMSRDVRIGIGLLSPPNNR